MDELLMRQMPHSIEAEQAVIGSMLIDFSCVPDVVELLTIDDFYVPENSRIFETIYSMFVNAKKIDAVTVLNELKTMGYYDEAGGRAYLLQIMDITPTAKNVHEYVSIVRDKSMLRQIIGVTTDISNLAFTDGGSAGDIAEIAEQRIYSIRHGREIKGLIHIKNIILELYKNLDELAQRGGKIPGISTGFYDLDNALTGLNDSDLILIAARPGMGKTSFAMNIALAAAKDSKKNIAVFQLEMSKSQLAGRFLSNEALVDAKKLKIGDLSDDDWIKIARASNILSKAKIYIDDNPAITVAEIKAKCRRMGDELALVVIDYLQLMQSGKKSDNRVQEVSEISRSLKIMAKELNVPVVCLSQLSRASEQRADKRPMLSDLRESGAIEQDADIVMFLYRDDYYNDQSEKRNIAEVIIAKNRHGALSTVELQWLGEFTSFQNQEKIYVI